MRPKEGTFWMDAAARGRQEPAGEALERHSGFPEEVLNEPHRHNLRTSSVWAYCGANDCAKAF